jgi:sec-independent protein translocase protein TatA
VGGLSIWHILIVGMIALLLFGGSGKISDLMGDVAKGVKSFKRGLNDDGEEDARIDARAPQQVAPSAASIAPDSNI